MKLRALTLTVLNLSAALDTGKFDSLTVEEACSMIQSGDLVEALRSRCGQDIDLSYFDAEPFISSRLSYIEALKSLLDVGGAERKWGIQNRGLCLLISWTNELIQQQKFTN